MTFVTKLRFQSGDRAALDDTVDGLRDMLERKGAECKGPHTEPSEHVRVPLYDTLAPGSVLGEWSYELFSRRIEIHGNDHIAREVGHMDFPDSVHVEIELEQREQVGTRG
ncbi:uS10/mL48 family ribosomal protein [Halorarum halobium]|uniref:uS10/mL48 family ribosomal protein n=1 Tax=Halorarum halobium TaxID=3075121 RepID=UPI0028AC33F4|nr:uS10/mL48 family ribosomal protein [Halobaculum sp. XH14]